MDNIEHYFGSSTDLPEPCPDCGGSGKYVGFLMTDVCLSCGGTGRSMVFTKNKLVGFACVSGHRAKREITWDDVKTYIPSAYDHNLTLVFTPWLSDPDITHQPDSDCVWYDGRKWLLSIMGMGTNDSLAWRWQPLLMQWTMIDASQVR